MSMTNEKVLEILKEAGAFLTGHFLLTSGRHSDKYLQCAKLFEDSKLSEELCRELADKFKEDGIELVVGPAIGAILISYEVSRQLGVKNIFAERENGEMTFRRGFNIQKGQKVLIVEDVVTTGGSVREVMKIVSDLGADIVGIGSIVDRSGGKAHFGVPYKNVLSMEVMSYEADECPICKEGIPLVKPGSRNLSI